MSERGGYEWLSDAKAAEYLDRERLPERRLELTAAHALMLDLLEQAPDAAFRFLDLGAGAGAVSASVMALFPAATGVLVDFSAPMMKAGADALAGFGGRYTYVEHDMNSEDWPRALDGPFAAVVSARATHHLENRVKRRLLGRLHQALEPGGVLVNWDSHRVPGEAAPAGDDPADPEDRMMAGIEEQLDLLRRAGFADVACPHVLGRRAIFFGRRAR
jgi:SAM-dependent methyltransferase